jgi:hypothetical protein
MSVLSFDSWELLVPNFHMSQLILLIRRFVTKIHE